MGIKNNCTIGFFCNNIKVPLGEFLNPDKFNSTAYPNLEALKKTENINPNIVDSIVNHLSRFMFNKDVEETFRVSLQGAGKVNQTDKAFELMESIKGLDDESIKSACLLVQFETAYHSPYIYYKTSTNAVPDEDTIHNIRVMVNRCSEYINQLNIIDSGIVFRRPYCGVINSGHADFLTEDSVVHIKATNKRPVKNNILRVLVQHVLIVSLADYSHLDITNLVIFNPRLNIVYIYDVNKVKKENYNYLQDCIFN